MLMGVSDRSRQENGTFYTMPSVLALLHAQRQAAKEQEHHSGIRMEPWEERIVWPVM